VAVRCILTVGRELKMEILVKIKQLQRSSPRFTQDRLRLLRMAVKNVFPLDIGHAATPPPLPPPPRQKTPMNEMNSRSSLRSERLFSHGGTTSRFESIMTLPRLSRVGMDERSAGLVLSRKASVS